MPEIANTEQQKETKYYYAHIVTGVQTKNKLQEAVKSVVESYGNKIYTGSEFSEAKKKIIKNINELNEQFPRCSSLEPSFASYTYDGNVHLYGLDFIYLHFLECTMYKS